MKTIICDDFLLQTQTAKNLYHTYAKHLPIIDYHCHLDPKEIAQNRPFTDVGQMMLGGDHYKWRLMRTMGVDERYVTGETAWKEKFLHFAKVLPYCVGNPLYHWTHLELKRYFGIDEILCEESAQRIYDTCNETIAREVFSPQALILRSGVEALCTTDDPADSLAYHQAIRESGFSVKVLPTYRPDKVLNIHKDTFVPYIKSIGITTYDGLKQWLLKTLDHFQAQGCRLSDHGLDFVPYKKGSGERVFAKALAGGIPTREEAEIYMTDLLLFLGKEFAKRGFTMQIHIGAQRNNNTLAYRTLGADFGYDSIADTAVTAPLGRLLDALEQENALPKTILYSLNPKDNLPLATLMGCFQGGIRGKLQLGSGWWFNDQKFGMEQQMQDLASVGVLGCFVGMLTDSRSFLSYPRHEYFRRILCNLLGTWVDEGQYPKDMDALGTLVRGICYENAKHYFNFV